jgi:hypothetical protein
MREALYARDAVDLGTLLIAAAVMGWGDWDRPALLSPRQWSLLQREGLTDRRDCARFLDEYLSS